MKRMVLIILRNLLRLPYVCFMLCYYARRADEHSFEHKYVLIKKIAGWIVSTGKIDIAVSGLEKLPEENGFMLFPNHQGLFDAFAIVEVCPRPLSTVYKKELQDIPFLKQIFSCVNAFALDRDSIRQGLEVMNEVARKAQDGRNYIIFAEGTRSLGKNKLLDFKGGSFRSAARAKCPIVPVALIDSYKVFDTGSIARTTVEVHFLDAICYEDYEGLRTAQIAELVKAAIEKAIAEHSDNH